MGQGSGKARSFSGEPGSMSQTSPVSLIYVSFLTILLYGAGGRGEEGGSCTADSYIGRIKSTYCFPVVERLYSILLKDMTMLRGFATIFAV